MSEPTTVEPCPFCGHRNTEVRGTIDESGTWKAVHCLHCGAKGPDALMKPGWSSSPDGVWNRRVLTDDVLALEAVLEKLQRARRLHPTPYRSAHEGYAILLEEVDELWAEVKAQPGSLRDRRIRAEVIQVATVACRFLLDVCGKDGSQ